MKQITTLFVAIFCVCMSLNSMAQNHFQPYSPTDGDLLNQTIKSNSADYYALDIVALTNQIKQAPYREDMSILLSTFTVQLPNLKGGFNSYKVLRNQTMHPDLNAKYPNMYTFDGINVTDISEKVKLDITPQGFHAMIYAPHHSTIFIDPIHSNAPNKVMVYYKKDFYTDKVMSCEFESQDEAFKKAIESSTATPEYGSCQLRTYRLALAATAEYTTYHTNATLAAAAQVTTMNRVNGVYERDIAITMTLVANNNLLIYTNAATDPYTNGNAGVMINQNVSNCNAVIGFANYDIGHVFGTNSGGLAGLGVVCGTNKARGVTGSSNPVGDPFDIDYVAHEIGHQFNGNHTQNNNCNRNNPTAVEPGSASTIMGYAGICAPNIQNNSDDHFHGITLSEMTTLITSASHTCPVITTLTNSAPTITSTNGNVSVPASTPFALTCLATDLNGDTLSYNWEQTDNAVSTQAPVATSIDGPNFRSLPSSTNPTRYFPNLVDLANNGSFTWEVVPSVSRTMNFRCSVRDNSAGPGGCSDHVNVTVSTVASAGPFVVTYPTATGIVWAGSSTQTVTWSVANTTAAPINASLVDIYLSTDGGLTYPTLLLANTPNDGSQAISVPNLATTTARIMVISSAGTFFDISNNNFEITASTFDYTLSAPTSNAIICSGTNASYTITSAAIGAYTTPINLSTLSLPLGATASFVPSTITPGQNAVLTISNAPVGLHNITVEGNSAGNVHTVSIVLDVQNSTVSPPTLLSPANGAINQANPTSFSWSASPLTGATYTIEISDSPSFATILDQATGLTSPNYTSVSLASNTTFYWRVQVSATCGNSSYTQATYTTNACLTFSSPNVPVFISPIGTNTVTSTINVVQTGILAGITVPKVQGTHSYVSDLTINLISPSGIIVPLMSGICSSDDDYDLGFDDAASTGIIPCPPTTGAVYQPAGSLSTLIGANVQGIWTLQIIDGFNQDGGTLDFWSLEFCLAANPCVQPSVPVISGPTSICAGESANLSLTGNLNDATQWEWYTASCGGVAVGTGTTVTVSPTANTSYFVRGTGGCVTNAACGSQAISVTNLNTNVVQSGSLLTAQQTNSSYQWLICSDNYAVIPGATASTFSPAQLTGSYAVQVSNNGCSDTSACFDINLAGLGDLNALDLTLAPNPNNGVVTLSWDEMAQVQQIDVLDAKGRQVYVDRAISGKTHMLNLTHLESAVYLIRVHHQTGEAYIRMIKAE